MGQWTDPRAKRVERPTQDVFTSHPAGIGVPKKDSAVSLLNDSDEFCERLHSQPECNRSSWPAHPDEDDEWETHLSNTSKTSGPGSRTTTAPHSVQAMTGTATKFDAGSALGCFW